MADKPKTGWIDNRLTSLTDYLGAQISRFVAFLFLLFAAGAIFGAFVYTTYPKYGLWFILAPIVLGLIAYYSRTFAIILFAIFAAFFVF